VPVQESRVIVPWNLTNSGEFGSGSKSRMGSTAMATVSDRRRAVPSVLARVGQLARPGESEFAPA
jgi:hypothetical protein